MWADLNAAGSCKFSDADFLDVMGWNCFEDDTSPNDQRCDSVNMKRWIRDPDPANAERMKPKALGRRLGEESVRKKLRRAICHFQVSTSNGKMINKIIGTHQATSVPTVKIDHTPQR